MRSVLLLFLFPGLAMSQSVMLLEHVNDLPASQNETSTLQFIQGTCWSSGDSGNPNELYQLDTVTGQVLRTVILTNTTNVDWEEMTATPHWTYIGDFGNNLGSRTDLRIYRVSTDSLLDPSVTQLTADTITFEYGDQTDFTPANMATRYDMEAMVARNDSLFLFSKDWVNQRTRVYAFPAQTGHHILVPMDSMEVNGLVTAADIDTAAGTLVLLGYAFGLPSASFLVEIDATLSDPFNMANATKFLLQPGDHQMEGVAIGANRKVWISNEQLFGDPPALWQSTYALEVEDPGGFSVNDIIEWGEPFLITDMVGRVADESNENPGIVIEYYRKDGLVRAVKSIRIKNN